MNRQELERAAIAAADRCLKARGYIAFDEMFIEMGRLEAKHWNEWRRGQVPYLEQVIRLNLSQIKVACQAVQANSRRGNLKPSWTAYVKWGKGTRTPLRFTKSGDPHLERVWATRFVGAPSRPKSVESTSARSNPASQPPPPEPETGNPTDGETDTDKTGKEPLR
jgi:hypothetical protein